MNPNILLHNINTQLDNFDENDDQVSVAKLINSEYSDLLRTAPDLADSVYDRIIENFSNYGLQDMFDPTAVPESATVIPTEIKVPKEKKIMTEKRLNDLLQARNKAELDMKLAADSLNDVMSDPDGRYSDSDEISLSRRIDDRYNNYGAAVDNYVKINKAYEDAKKVLSGGGTSINIPPVLDTLYTDKPFSEDDARWLKGHLHGYLPIFDPNANILGNTRYELKTGNGPFNGYKDTSDWLDWNTVESQIGSQRANLDKTKTSDFANIGLDKYNTAAGILANFYGPDFDQNTEITPDIIRTITDGRYIRSKMLPSEVHDKLQETLGTDIDEVNEITDPRLYYAIKNYPKYRYFKQLKSRILNAISIAQAKAYRDDIQAYIDMGASHDDIVALRKKDYSNAVPKPLTTALKDVNLALKQLSSIKLDPRAVEFNKNMRAYENAQTAADRNTITNYETSKKMSTDFIDSLRAINSGTSSVSLHDAFKNFLGDSNITLPSPENTKITLRVHVSRSDVAKQCVRCEIFIEDTSIEDKKLYEWTTGRSRPEPLDKPKPIGGKSEYNEDSTYTNDKFNKKTGEYERAGKRIKSRRGSNSEQTVKNFSSLRPEVKSEVKPEEKQ